MMYKDIEITLEIKGWDALASIAIDLLSEFNDVLIGETQEDRIFMAADNDKPLDRQSNVTGQPKELTVEYVDCDTLPIEFGNDSLYSETNLSLLFGNTDSDILYSISEDVTVKGGIVSNRFFENFFYESRESNTDSDILYHNSEDVTVKGGIASDRFFENSPHTTHKINSDIDTGDDNNEAEIFKKVLLDADIILDVLLNRECPTLEDLEDSVAAFDLVSSKQVKGYIASSDFDQIVLLSQRLLNPENASRIEQKLLNFLQVCEVDGQLLRETSQMSLPTYKNTIQLACALRYNLDAIVTVNSQDFWSDETYHPDINVFTPSQFLNNYYGLDACECVNDEYGEFREKLEKDLEADCMVNEEILDKKLSLGTGWVVDSWIVRSDQNNFTEASVILRNPTTSDRHPAFVRVQAPIEASCNALDKLVKQLFDEVPEYSFKKFVTRNVSDEGAASTVEATVIVQCGDLTYTSNYTHKSIIQAVFYAYVKSVDRILRRETPEKADKPVSNFVNKSKWTQGLP